MSITRLPTEATSYYTVRKVRGGWGFALVTPCLGKDLTTVLYILPGRDAAIAYGMARAARANRQFRLRGTV